MEKQTDPEVVGKPGRKPFKVSIQTDLTSDEELFRVSEILYKLRYYGQRWKDNFGADNRAAKDRWEVIADNWINEHVKIEK